MGKHQDGDNGPSLPEILANETDHKIVEEEHGDRKQY